MDDGSFPKNHAILAASAEAVRPAERLSVSEAAAKYHIVNKGWEAPSGKRNEAWDLLYYCVGLCRDPRIGLDNDNIDWTSPPRWTEVWDLNDLVFEGAGQPRFAQAKNKVDLDQLGALLA